VRSAGRRIHIDPSHTYASFEIDHLGFSTQRGQFNQSSGTRIRPAPTGRIDITIDTASLDTGFALRDEVLRSDTGSTPRTSRNPLSAVSPWFSPITS
jgi:polyisoprenoid-binding protein YceI